MRAKLVTESILGKIKNKIKYSKKIDKVRTEKSGFKRYVDEPPETRYNYGAYREWKDGRDAAMGSDEEPIEWTERKVLQRFDSVTNPGNWEPGDKEYQWAKDEAKKWPGLTKFMVNTMRIEDPFAWIAKRL